MNTATAGLGFGTWQTALVARRPRDCAPAMPPERPASRRLKLARDDSLRIEDGPGTRVHVLSGVAWLTEEGKPDDVILQPATTHEIAHPGVVLLLACETARVVLELPPDTDPPCSVALKRGAAARWRPVAWPFRATSSLALGALLGFLRRMGVIWRKSRPVETCATSGGWYDHDILHSSRRTHVRDYDRRLTFHATPETARDALMVRYPGLF